MTALSSVSKNSKTRGKKLAKRLAVALGVLALLILFGLFGIALPTTKLVADAKALKDAARPLKDAAATQDLSAIKTSLQRLREVVVKTQNDYAGLSWARFVPIVSAYYSDGQHVLNAALAGNDAGIKTVEALYPHAGKIGLKTTETEAFGSMKEKAAALLSAMPEIAPSLSSIQVDIDTVNKELSKVEPTRYPNTVLKGYNIRELLSAAKDTSSAISQAFPDIKQGFVVVPPAFGAGNTVKNYVLIFKNDKELRPTGGFWTAYALVTFKNGQLVDIKSNDMYNLDGAIGLYNHPAPPPFFKGFLDVDYFYARDANISPDFVISGQKFQDFWRLAGMPKIDGVWALDTYVLQELLHNLGPVEVSGYA